MLLQQELGNSKAKNLSRLWEYEESRTLIMDSCGVLMNKWVHRGKVTAMLLTDNIYTGSKDYSVSTIRESEGIFGGTIAIQVRGAIEHLAPVQGKTFLTSRDSYLRSVDGSYFHKFDSIPLSFY